MNRLTRFLRNPEIIGPPDCPLMLRWTLLDSEHPTTSTDSDREGASGEITKAEHALTFIKLPRWLTRDRKLMIHHFLPNVEERDFHDHPRSFWTLVLRGRYFDLIPCPFCNGTGSHRTRIPTDVVKLWGRSGDVVLFGCMFCRRGCRLGETMKAGMLRYRPATHAHITQADSSGAWTVVWMLPLERPWGFWHQGIFFPWRKYKERFGFGMECPTDEEREKAIAAWSGEIKN